MRYLSNFKGSFKDKICLLRVDFNVENPENALRLEASLPTIKFLLQHHARIMLLSHRGRPKGVDSPFSLKPVLPFLRKNLSEEIIFFPHFPEQRPANGQIMLMENLRFHNGEDSNSLSFAQKLAALGDFYVNDAFAVSHRKNASVAQLPKLLPAYAGLLLEKEIKTLSSVMTKPAQPLVLILGGAKISDKTGVIKNFLDKAAHILIGGAVANNFLAAQKINIGESLVEPDMIPTAKKLLNQSHIVVPSDWLMDQNRIVDIGPETIKKFTDIISGAATVIWNGPMGLFENPKFAEGSRKIAQAIAGSGSFSVVGGGETTELIIKMGLRNKFSFLSTGGGAMLEFLSGKKLPGIEALK